MKDIAIYGAGGFGREIACLINQINEIKPQWNMIGFFDDGVAAGTSNRYGSVLGNYHTLNKYNKPLSIAIAIATPKYLKKISESITNKNIEFPNIIAPNVNIFDTSAFTIGKGNLIFFGCRLSCDVSIGNYNLFNGAVSIGHDVKVGNYNVLQPSVRISGDSTLGNENFFGMQSIVLQGMKIGNKTRVAVGAVIMRNTKDDYLYMGNPARKIII